MVPTGPAKGFNVSVVITTLIGSVVANVSVERVVLASISKMGMVIEILWIPVNDIIILRLLTT